MLKWEAKKQRGGRRILVTKLVEEKDVIRIVSESRSFLCECLSDLFDILLIHLSYTTLSLFI